MQYTLAFLNLQPAKSADWRYIMVPGQEDISLPSISQRLATVSRDIARICKDCGRDPDTVQLLAVSKAQPIAAVQAAIQAGQSAFGENYLQDALLKVDALPSAEWHFIGAVQSNKTRDIAAHFDWVHSVPSFKVARRLSEQRPETMGPLNVLVQVNLSDENQKSGVLPEEASELIDSMTKLKNIRIRGLMTIPSPASDFDAQRVPFALLRELMLDIARTRSIEHFDQLSMGMSGDYAAAIHEGATWIRIGTAIFGPRN